MGRNKKPFEERTKFGKLIAKVSPILWDTIKKKVPGGEILGKVGELIFGGKAKEVLTPEELADFKAMYELELQELDMRLQDTQNARAMQMAALQQGDKFAKRFVYIIALIVLLAAIGFGVSLFFIELPEDNFNRMLIKTFADVFLFAGALQVLNYFFGSSRGSKQKTDMSNLEKLMKGEE